MAGGLEKRVWTKTGKVTFPHLYTLLIGPPSVGKTEAIQPVADIWRKAKLKLAPDSVTSASLVDSLEAAGTIYKLSELDIIEYHSMQVPATEFGVLVPGHDLEFLNKLNRIYDTPPFHHETRRTTKKEVSITHPQLTILGGTQPGYLAAILPESAWTMGFMSRQIMVYAPSPIRVPLFGQEKSESDALWKALISDMKQMTKLYGEMTWHPEAMEAIMDWWNKGLDPVPEHSKLLHYNGRRIVHMSKLPMISAASRGNNLVITLEDFERAKNWLLAAEVLMPDVFKDMTAKSDQQVIADLHFMMWRQWSKTNRKPIHTSMIVHFLQGRVPSERIGRIIAVAEQANIISRLAGTEDRWIPKHQSVHGVEE